MTLLSLLSILVGGLLAAVASYLLVFAIAGRAYRTPVWPPARYHRRIAVVIPAYREDAVILDTVDSALAQDYPADRFDVVVVADRLGMGTLKMLAQRPVRTIPVEFEQSTKVKALRKAVETLQLQAYEAITILDADNHMQPGFLQRTNGALEAGWTAIQGLRAAKNEERAVARFDGLTEGMNTNIFRRGHVVLGLPSALTGSGMTFEWNLFASWILTAQAVGGFDKEFELHLTCRGTDIAYDEGAIVLDEKVSTHAGLARQRSRWLGAQWHYARLHMAPALGQWRTHRNLAYADKALQMVLPPRVLMLASASAGSPLIWWGLGPVAAAPWVLALVLLLSALLISASVSTSRLHWSDLFQIPAALFSYLRGLVQSRTANRSFVHTVHRAHTSTSN